jgi:hypothetical protein
MPVARLLASLAALPLFALPATAQDLHLSLDQPDASWHGATAIADGQNGAAAHFDGAEARIDCGPCAVDHRSPFTLRLQLRTARADFCTPLMARDGEAVGIHRARPHARLRQLRSVELAGRQAAVERARRRRQVARGRRQL